MTSRTLVLALLAPCLLAACTNETTIPEATDAAAARTSTAAASKPAAPVSTCRTAGSIRKVARPWRTVMLRSSCGAAGQARVRSGFSVRRPA